MKTSKNPDHLVFYKKRDCAPCAQASLALDYVLSVNPEFEPYITVLQKEDHPDLVKANDLSLYPTVLIVDRQGNEISRKVGGKFLTHEWFNAALYAIHRRHIDE